MSKKQLQWYWIGNLQGRDLASNPKKRWMDTDSGRESRENQCKRVDKDSLQQRRVKTDSNGVENS